MVLNKRGDDKYYIIISLILGIIVLGLSLYFIFQEYLNQDDIDWEICRQSVILRANLPEASKFGVTPVSFKDKYPLKCKNEVVIINKKDIEENKYPQIIGDTFVGCWHLFGNGDFDIFPSKTYGPTTSCVPCARISLSREAEEYMIQENIKIDIESILLNERFGDLTYLSYLNGVGDEFHPFDPAFTGGFNLSGKNFKIDFSTTLLPYFFGENFKTKKGKNQSPWGVFASVDLPKRLDPSLGDLIIVYGSVTYSGDSDISQVPYLFYYQINDPSLNENFKETFFQWSLTGADPTARENLCNNWEGIPA